MKKLLLFLLAIAIIAVSCKKDDEDSNNDNISGDQSPIGEVGTTVSTLSIPIAGVSDFSASVTALSDGVSSVTGSAVIENDFLKNFFANYPGVNVSGNVVTTTQEFKATSEGVELVSGPSAGIWVKYGSVVGDTYPINSTGQMRTVTYKSTDDDYGWGMMLIKVIKVEESTSYLKSTGISKITYIANHRFGMVGAEFTLDDGSSVVFPIYLSAEN